MAVHDTMRRFQPGVDAAAAEADDEALAGHLATCPRRASLAARDAALTRLWESTRPAEPPAAAWDAVWARVSERLDRPEPAAAEPLVLPARPLRRYALTAFAVAQAAALLAAAVLWAAHRRPAETPTPFPPVAAVPAPVPHRECDVNTGTVTLIHLEGKDLRVEEMPGDERPDVLDDMLLTFNYVEAMAEMHHDANVSRPPG